ncbi:MAG TPA: DUF2125 domain-containing protein [Caulobacteraceae bacterium]|jgi:hypothetical protein
MSDAAPAPRPPSRLWLILPFALVGIVLVAFCAWWFVAANRLQAGIDEAARAHREAGRTLEWRSRRVSGFPFRLKVTFEDLRFASPGGWAVQAPRLEAQANAYRLTHWVGSAPRGLTIVRPVAGAVRIDARVLRASVSGADQNPPRIAVEGVDLRFAPGPGAEPFAFAAAERFELHLRAASGAEEDAEFVVRLKQAAPRPAGLVSFVSAGRAADIVWDSRLTRFDAFKGRDWASAVAAWTERGGHMQVNQASFLAGDVSVRTRDARLSVGRDGRLRGRLDLALNRPLQALTALTQLDGASPDAAATAGAIAQARGANAALPLSFEAGVMTIGPVRLGDAPRVY